MNLNNVFEYYYFNKIFIDTCYLNNIKLIKNLQF